MSGYGGVSIGRTRGENRFYNPPAIRQRQQQQRQKLEQEKHQRQSVESDDCATSHSSGSGRAVLTDATNLDRFLEYTTPVVQAQYIPKAHFAEGSHFNFQKYIRRILEKDFGVVMGISWWIWLFSVFVIFFNAHGFYNYLWVPFIPLVMLLLVGTKLQGIITKMCLDSHDKSHVVRVLHLVVNLWLIRQVIDLLRTLTTLNLNFFFPLWVFAGSTCTRRCFSKGLPNRNRNRGFAHFVYFLYEKINGIIVLC
ncbi:unnamed protein product, partial [Prunus brigantina]